MRDFNFFSPYIDKSKEAKDRNLYYAIGAAIIGIIIVGTFAWNSISILKLNNDIKSLNAELSKPDKIEKLKQAEELNKKQEILNKYYVGVNVIFNTINSNNAVSSDLLTSLSATLPGGVSFKSMAIDGQTIQIQGTGNSRTSIGELEYNLKKLGKFSEVQVSSINGGDKDDYAFALKCTLKDVEKNENK
ncbi:fimbrial assembly protein PilN [Clostridiales bacterium oral taxon 876 str. F0540]|nr:fimbrial assembly protein PilN [Clostridiales bacterium oral taxon 876 str. F0540]